MKECLILTKPSEIAAFADDWTALAARAAHSCFASPAFVTLWLRERGQIETTKPHILALRRKGRLTGVLPLCVTRKKGLRLLRWIGHDVFFGPLHLFETEDDRRALWQAAINSPHYDVAKVKYFFKGSPEQGLLRARRFVSVCETSAMTQIAFPEKDDAPWQSSLPAALQKSLRHRGNVFARYGQASFHASRSGAVPYDRLQALLAMKKDWARAHDKQSGLFSQTSEDFALALARQADTQGTLVVTELRSEDRTAALTLCFAQGKTLFGYMNARDPAFKSASVGLLITAATASWAAENGFERLHMLEGEQSYKDAFITDKEPFEVLFWGRGFVGQTVAMLAALRRSLKRRTS